MPVVLLLPHSQRVGAARTCTVCQVQGTRLPEADERHDRKAVHVLNELAAFLKMYLSKFPTGRCVQPSCRRHGEGAWEDCALCFVNRAAAHFRRRALPSVARMLLALRAEACGARCNAANR